MQQIKWFFALNLAIYLHQFIQINKICERIGRNGYTVQPIFCVGNFPVWGFKKLQLERNTEAYHQFLNDTVNNAEYDAYLDHINTPRADNY